MRYGFWLVNWYFGYEIIVKGSELILRIKVINRLMMRMMEIKYYVIKYNCVYLK